jgi:peptidoglycan/LPS O-acetylase OafA/YrhL
MKIKKYSTLAEIELLRFLAMLSVIFWHYKHLSNNGTKISEDFVISNQPYFNFFNIFYKYGQYGPELFWCLSGFIFFYVYFEKLSNKEINASEFIINRFSRLYPLHFATLILTAFLQMLIFQNQGDFFIYENNNFKHFILHLLFISNWGLEDGFSFNGPIWSVSLEIIVYGIFFFLVRNFNIFLVFILSSLLFLFFLNINPALASCILLFFSGGYLAISKYNYYFFGKKKIFQKLNTFNIIILSATGLYQLLYFNFDTFDKIIPTRLFFLTIVVIFCNLNFLIKLIKLEKICIFFGKISYGGYLIHIPIQLFFFLISKYLYFSLNYNNNILFFTYIFSVFVLSYISFKFFEEPWKNKIRKFFKNFYTNEFDKKK